MPATATTSAANPDGDRADAGDASATTEPNCEGKNAFTEACGYASPTRYAVLDPNGIRNG